MKYQKKNYLLLSMRFNEIIKLSPVTKYSDLYAMSVLLFDTGSTIKIIHGCSPDSL